MIFQRNLCSSAIMVFFLPVNNFLYLSCILRIRNHSFQIGQRAMIHILLKQFLVEARSSLLRSALASLGDGDLVGVLVQAQHHRVHGVRSQGGDCVRIHFVVHLNIENVKKNISLEPISTLIV